MAATFYCLIKNLWRQLFIFLLKNLWSQLFIFWYLDWDLSRLHEGFFIWLGGAPNAPDGTNTGRQEQAIVRDLLIFRLRVPSGRTVGGQTQKQVNITSDFGMNCSLPSIFMYIMPFVIHSGVQVLRCPNVWLQGGDQSCVHNFFHTLISAWHAYTLSPSCYCYHNCLPLSPNQCLRVSR